MDTNQARQIIKETFETSFNEVKFTTFIINLLNLRNEQIENKRPYSGNIIPDAYDQHISTLKRIAKYTDGEHEIDILIVKLKKETTLERARTKQRNFVAWYLNGSRGGKLKDASLVAFVSPDEEDWRFSLVKMDYKFEEGKNGKIKVKEEFTPARRWSFLVGKNEKSHTAQSRLVSILTDDKHNPTLSQFEEAFNIEKVTKEFFEKYRELFLWTEETLDGIVKKDKKIRSDFEAKGVNTVDFAKKLLGQIVFLYFLQKKGWFGVQRDADWGTGDKHFLRELFEGKHCKYKNFFNDILEPLFYEAFRINRNHDDDYYSRFDCKIPFLNGGLFDPINNYNWVHTDILFPDELFSNNYKTKEGDTGNGILDIFDRYNFTVKEDEPLEKEVAIDPEMLGKVFENLLEVKDRKSKGTYYTPREIVHYMCQQSLRNYLYAELNQGTVSYEKLGDPQLDAFGNKAKTGQLVLTTEHKSYQSISKEEIETLIKFGEQVSENEATVETKGRETETYSYKLSENIRKNAKLIDEKLASIKVCDPAIGSGAFPVGMMTEIVKTRNVLTAYLSLRGTEATKQSRSIYNFKRECIEKSLYGVDIDSSAVEIAKLRLWLSLVVDEDDIKQIKPLPNLDYKIVCGNSLLGYPYEPIGLNKIEKLKEQFIGEVDINKKNELRKQIDEVIYGLFKDTEKSLGYQVTMDFKVNFSEVFHERKGFDVVIGNPPWGQKSIKFSETDKKYFKKMYPSATIGILDIFRLFVERAINIVCPRGYFANVLPDIILLKNYNSTRKFILDNLSITRIDHWGRAFENVNLDSCTLIGEKTIAINKNNNIVICTVHSDNGIVSNKISQAQFLQTDGYKFNLYLCSETCDLINELKKERRFGDFFDPHEGIHSGNIRDKLFIDKKINKNCKKLIFGRDEISKYHLFWDGKWVNYDKNIINKVSGEYAGLGKPEYFEKHKIIVRRTGDYILGAMDEDGYYFSNNVFVCVPKKDSGINMKYVLGILNSKLATWFYRTVQPRKGKLFAELKINVLKQIPIKETSSDNQKPIIELVDKLLIAKKGNSEVDTSAIEDVIDQLVYDIFELTKEQRQAIEKS